MRINEDSVLKSVEISEGSYILTWTSERMNRLLSNSREAHLWSDFHTKTQVKGQLWSSEDYVRISQADAEALILEWVAGGPFMKLEEDIQRLPETILPRLPEYLQKSAGWSQAANG